MAANDNIRKVAIVIPTLHKGGAEKVLVHFVNNLDYTRIQPIIFCLKKEGVLLASINPEVIVEDLNCPRVYFSIFKIRKALKKYKPDALIGWMGHINAVLAILKPFLPGRMALLCRESSIPSFYIKTYSAARLFRFMYRYLNRYDGIVCQSEAMKSDLIRNFRVKENKIRKIHNPVIIDTVEGVNPEVLSFVAGAGKVLLYVGRFSPEKRTELLLDVLKILPEGYKLIMVGYGPLEHKVRLDIANKGLTDRVLLITDCGNPASLYKRADCLLLTSSFEGFPNVLLEASMCGCPAVVYQTEGGAREIINEENGIYIPGDKKVSLSEFASSVIEICNNPQRYDRKRISDRASSEYEIKKIIKQYGDYIEEIIEKRSTLKIIN